MKQPGPEADAKLMRRLDQLMDLLVHWNGRINLVGPADRDTLWQRHIADSLQLAPLLPEGRGAMADLGSGAGFPGLVLAMMTGRQTHLIEADRRKAAFLLEAAARLTLDNVTVHGCRIETLRLPRIGVVTARALAPLARLIPLAMHVLDGQCGVALLPKGEMAEAELLAVQDRWHFEIERFPSTTDPRSTILRLSHIRPVHAA